MSTDHDEQFASVPPEDPAEVTEVPLRDGSRIWIRPIRPTDRGHLEHGMSHLSSRSRYLRFHTMVQELSDSQLDYLTDVDHHNHEALLALDPDQEGTPGVGVARYIRLEDEPHVAEAAITVADDHQRRGIGTILLGRLQVLAREREITTFRNYVLAENKGMLAIFRDLGGSFTPEGASLYRVDVPVPEDVHSLPDTPAGLLVKSVAGATTPPAADWAFPQLWPLRRVAGVGRSAVALSKLLKNVAVGLVPTGSDGDSPPAADQQDSSDTGSDGDPEEQA